MFLNKKEIKKMFFLFLGFHVCFSLLIFVGVSLLIFQRFRILTDFETQVKRFNLKARKVQCTINPVPPQEEPTTWIKDAIEDILRLTIKDLSPEDKVGVTFSGEGFSNSRGSGWVNFKNCSELSFHDVWEMISKIFQSNSQGISTDTFSLSVTSVKMPVGTGKKSSQMYNSFEEECLNRKGIICIQNKDNLCLPRALIVGKAYADSDVNFRKVRRDIGKIQTSRTLELLKEMEINIPSSGCGIEELKLFQNHLKDYKITVYEYRTKGRKVIYEGVPNSDKKINLIYFNNHFNVITSLTAAFCCSYYCEICHKPLLLLLLLKALFATKFYSLTIRMIVNIQI